MPSFLGIMIWYPTISSFFSSVHLAYKRTTVNNVALKILAWEWHVIDSLLSVFPVVAYFLSQHGVGRTYMEVKLLLRVVWTMDHNSPPSLPFRPSRLYFKSQLGLKSTAVQLWTPRQQRSAASSSDLETRWELWPFIPILHRRYGYYRAGLSAHCPDREGMLLCRQRGALMELPPFSFVH